MKHRTERGHPGNSDAQFPRLTRRTLLKAAAAWPLVHVLSACGDTKPPATTNSTAGRTAIVVGGGLCGLLVLDRLVKAGWNVRLLEASTRLGGRIRTVRDGLSSGLRAEMGAERVPKSDTRLRGLLEDLGIETTPYPAPTRPPLLIMGGNVMKFGMDSTPLPETFLAGLSEVEREQAPLACHLGVARVSQEPAPDDPRTAVAWLRAAGLTKRGEELSRLWCVHDLDAVPAAAYFRAAFREFQARDSESVVGGTERIIERVAASLQSRITTATPIVRVEQDGNGVKLTDAKGALHQADYAAFCLPLKPMRALTFAGAPPAALTARLDAFSTDDEIKVCAEVPASTFAAEGRAEYTFRERFPRVSWRLPEETADGRFVYSTMAFRSDVAELRRAAAYGPDGVANLLASRAPEIAAVKPKVLTYDFASDPHIGAAVSYVRAKAGLEGTPIKDGRIVFAGGDISDAPGWMDGAVGIADAAADMLIG